MHDFLVDAECLLEVRIYVGYELVCVYQDHWKRAFCEKCFLGLELLSFNSCLSEHDGCLHPKLAIGSKAHTQTPSTFAFQSGGGREQGYAPTFCFDFKCHKVI